MRKDLVVFRCEECIKDLEEYNPYVYENEDEIPLDKIEIIKVDKHMCENNELNMHAKSQLQVPIMLTDASERPWSIKYWESIYDREQGIASVYGKYETFEEAKSAIEDSSYAKYWAAYEIILIVGEDEYSVYIYANTRPLADEFLPVNSKPKATEKKKIRKCENVENLKRFVV